MAIDSDRAVRLITEVWTIAIRQVLTQVSGTPLEIAPGDRGEERESARAEWKEAAWFCVESHGRLAGDHAFVVPPASSSFLAARFKAKPPEEMAEDSAGCRQALAELFRQVSKRASRALSNELGFEVKLELVEQKSQAWEPENFHLFRLIEKEEERANLSLTWSQEFIRSLDECLGSGMGTEPAEHTVVARERSTLPEDISENVGLFLDIGFDARLRFGSREIAISDVLDLVPGAAIELDKKLEDPVELLVCGKVIAAGDIVVVDGAYALRITEVASQSERLRSVSTKSAASAELQHEPVSQTAAS